MKFLKSLDVQHAPKLFNKSYRYKIVFRISNAYWFRGGHLENVEKFLEGKVPHYQNKNVNIEDIKFTRILCDTLLGTENWQIRVENPFLSLYLNDSLDLEKFVKLGKKHIKYVSIPDPANEDKIANGLVITKNLDFDYRITVGATNQNLGSFVHWSKNNPKIRLPKRASRDLSNDWSPGGSYFYVKDAKSLTMVKMFLGSFITKIESVVRS
jgi:hypothetical protein